MRPALSAALLAASAAAPAAAQTPLCAPLPVMIARLADGWGEQPVMRLTTRQGEHLTVWTNASSGSWTITATRVDGVTCIIVAGTGVETMAASLPPNI